jgi:pimeloyl-ACP methyl ester carboxylesterase
MVAPAPSFAFFRRSVNGVTLEGVEGGPPDGPLCILLHGFPEFWWGWRRQLACLAEAGYRVLAPDQRGYRCSSKPQAIADYRLDRLAGDVVGLVEVAGRRNAHLVGHDWGGIVAWWTAIRYPHRVLRLVVLNAPHPGVIGSYLRRHPAQILRSAYAGFFQLPVLPEAALRAGDFAALRRAMRNSSRPGTFSEGDLDEYAKTWREPGALTAMVNWYRALRLGRPPGGTVRAKTLVLWGEEDAFLETGLAAASLKLCEDGTLQRLPGASHWLHLEAPDVVNRAILDFLAEA